MSQTLTNTLTHYQNTVTPDEVGDIMKRYILRDGMDMVMDLDKSHGVYIHDSLHKRELLDFFTCFATEPVGYNHPAMVHDEAFKADLLRAAIINPTNSDIYTTQYAKFLQVFSRVAMRDYLNRAFFVAGGALAVENALKVAMDWKVQRNYQKGYTRTIGTKVLHFREAFHGRSGYTLSLTNTDINKVKYFAKFHDWPRVVNPKMAFPCVEEKLEETRRREKLAFAQIRRAFKENRDEICAIIIEPIQSEGGDNHFRKHFMVKLREICNEYDCLLIHDEVQVGVGPTGKFWAHEHFGENARPDIIAFGKKMQVCGIIAGPKIDEVKTNCFTVSSRINSTWGGNLVDMVRSARMLEIIEQDKLVQNAATVGKYFKERLNELFEGRSQVSNLRGRGLIIAFDLPTTELRNDFIRRGLNNNAVFLGCGTHSIRLRPGLIFSNTDVDKGIELIDKTLKQMGI